MWGAAEPGGVLDSEGGLVQAADVTPSPACGCGDLVTSLCALVGDKAMGGWPLAGRPGTGTSAWAQVPRMPHGFAHSNA